MEMRRDVAFERLAAHSEITAATNIEFNKWKRRRNTWIKRIPATSSGRTLVNGVCNYNVQSFVSAVYVSRVENEKNIYLSISRRIYINKNK